VIRPDELKRGIREYYAARASGGGCCGESACCGPQEVAEDFAGPSLGCGTPLAYADLRPGDTVVDLGSGAGREVLLAAQRVGPAGRAIGVDMTPAMITNAQENARRHGIPNAEFVLGEIEALPLPDATVNVVISNCVINLAPDKGQVFREAYRVLRPGGRLVVSDIVSRGRLPDAIRRNAAAWAGCLAGAEDAGDYLATITRAGFESLETVASTPWGPGKVFSITVRAVKPVRAGAGR